MTRRALGWSKKAMDRFNKNFSSQQVNTFAQWVDLASTFLGSKHVFRRIAQAKENEAIFDYLAEIRFALTFASLEFELQFEPCGDKGPDLWVSRNAQSAYVEVRRIRPSQVEPVLPFLDLTDETSEARLVEYGDLGRSVKKIEDELSDKFRQIGESTSIIACWSDRFVVEEIDFELAIRHLLIDSQTGAKRIPAGLLFCIFGWNWLVGGGQELHCGVLKELGEPFVTWVNDLKGARFSLDKFRTSGHTLQQQR